MSMLALFRIICWTLFAGAALVGVAADILRFIRRSPDARPWRLWFGLDRMVHPERYVVESAVQTVHTLDVLSTCLFVASALVFSASAISGSMG
jgi:hypothetical protein